MTEPWFERDYSSDGKTTMKSIYGPTAGPPECTKPSRGRWAKYQCCGAQTQNRHGLHSLWHALSHHVAHCTQWYRGHPWSVIRCRRLVDSQLHFGRNKPQQLLFCLFWVPLFIDWRDYLLAGLGSGSKRPSARKKAIISLLR